MPGMRIEQALDQLAKAAIAEVAGGDHPALLRATQDPQHGDYQLNAAMALGKKLGKSPREVAQPLAAKMATFEAIESAEVKGPGFVNLRLCDRWIAALLTEELSDDREGVPPVDVPQKIVVDFSSPNMAKQMHVGHLRSTIIGDAIVKMLRFVGHDVVGDNHLGDWGTQFGLLIVGMREFGDEEALERDQILELERVYKLASEKQQNDEAFAQSARDELAKLQAGDPDNLAAWRRCIDASKKALEAVYSRLGVEFDTWLGESAYNDALPGVVEMLLEKGIAKEDDGAVCVFFNELDGAPKDLRKRKEPFIVRKRDGAFLYSTSDIACVQYRQREIGADRAIYVVDARQALHFKQLFAVIKALGIDMNLEHVGFGVVLGDDGKPLRTRDASGNMVTLASLLNEAEQRAADRMRAEGMKIAEEDFDEVARVVGIGAVKYADLRQNRTSDYQFDWDKMISFKGNAGPYMQYAYARIRNIFSKGGFDPDAVHGPIVIGDPAEAALARQLLRFGEVVHAAAESCYPHALTDHLFSLARAFSTFYVACPVLKAEGDEVRDSRLALSALTSRQLRRGLTLLGINVVERM